MKGKIAQAMDIVTKNDWIFFSMRSKRYKAIRAELDHWCGISMISYHLRGFLNVCTHCYVKYNIISYILEYNASIYYSILNSRIHLNVKLLSAKCVWLQVFQMVRFLDYHYLNTKAFSVFNDTFSLKLSTKSRPMSWEINEIIFRLKQM